MTICGIVCILKFVNNLVIALLQMTSFGTDQAANQHKAAGFCEQAKEMGADIALFPEMWNIGCKFFEPTEPGVRQTWNTPAVDPAGEYLLHFTELASRLDMAIGVTYLGAWKAAPRNMFSLVDRRGEIVLTYAKVHTCDFDREKYLTPGDGFPVCDLATRSGVVKIGAMICFDREFPETARILMLNGAELILVPNACELEANRIAQLRSRAYENMVAIAVTNYACPQANGHSIAFDGMAFDSGETTRDMLVVEAGVDEGIYLARIDLEALRKYREREVWGNAYRRPELYGKITSDEVSPPFIRRPSR